MDTQTIIIAAISSGVVGSLLVFAQFLIQRKDAKADKNNEVLDAIDKLDTKINDLEKSIAVVDQKSDRRNAIVTRVRILRFEDELQEGKKHSKDSWDQVISDCDSYNTYCNGDGTPEHPGHPEFKNGQTEATVKHIRHLYDERIEKGDFR